MAAILPLMSNLQCGLFWPTIKNSCLQLGFPTEKKVEKGAQRLREVEVLLSHSTLPSPSVPGFPTLTWAGLVVAVPSACQDLVDHPSWSDLEDLVTTFPRHWVEL